MPAANSPSPWQRQMLVYLTPAGWRAAQDLPWPDEAAGCLAHWAAHDLPLVVARQDLDAGGGPRAGNPLASGSLAGKTLAGDALVGGALVGGALAGNFPIGDSPSDDLFGRELQTRDTLLLGLPAPLRWSRRRLALRVAVSHLDRPGRWPTLEAVLGGGSGGAQPARLATVPAAWLALPGLLRQAGLAATVYGSHGWQWLTGLPYVRDGSDLDLLVAVPDARAATLAAELLAAADTGPAALDGELVFADGRAVNWREWRRWSRGEARQVLFKSLSGATLAEPGAD